MPLEHEITWGIEGYTKPLSVEPGDRIDIMVSSPALTFFVTFLRLSRNAHPGIDTEGSPMTQVGRVVKYHGSYTHGPFPARIQTCKSQYPYMGCGWESSFHLNVPTDWESGMYAALCVDASGAEVYIVFIVRPPKERRSDFLVIAHTNTWNAYNTWGGQSRYTLGASVKDANLGFERPNPKASPLWPISTVHWPGANAEIRGDGGFVPVENGFQLRGRDFAEEETRLMVRGDLLITAWLEQNNPKIHKRAIRFDVWSDRDLHTETLQALAAYKGVILTTHPEYWTSEMREHVVAYLQSGGCLWYLGGNGAYERVTYGNAKEEQQYGSLMKVYGSVVKEANPRRPTRLRCEGRSASQILGVSSDSRVNAHSGYTAYTLNGEEEEHWLIKGISGIEGIDGDSTAGASGGLRRCQWVGNRQHRRRQRSKRARGNAMQPPESPLAP